MVIIVAFRKKVSLVLEEYKTGHSNLIIPASIRIKLDYLMFEMLSNNNPLVARVKPDRTVKNQEK